MPTISHQTDLEQLKKGFNPTRYDPLAIEVVAVGKDIPVFNGQLLTGADNIRIAGKVMTENAAIIQRCSSVEAENGYGVTLGQAAPIMDYVRIHAKNGNVAIGDHVTIAHGSHVIAEEGPVHFANGSFGNINIRVSGGIVEKDGYAGPGVVVGAKDRIGAGQTIFQDPPTQAEPRVVDGKITERSKRIQRRNILDVSGQLHDQSGTPLTLENYPGNEIWNKVLDDSANLKATRQTELPFEEWLRSYSLRQVGKASMHMVEQASYEGPVVWHGPALQSAILHVSKAMAIVAANNTSPEGEQLAADLGHLAKAQAYLVGVYQPQQGELPLLNNAYHQASAIIDAAGKYLGTLDKAVIDSPSRENAVSAVTGIVLDGASRQSYSYDRSDLQHLQDQLAGIAERAQKIQYQPAAGVPSSIRIREVQDAQAIRDALNPAGVNMLHIPDGPHIKTYDGAIPIIDKTAILVGKVDIAGSVLIGPDTVIHDSSIRSEQPVVPSVIQQGVVMRHGIVHTAGREQTPVDIGRGVFIDGNPGNRSVLHGPEIGQGSYVAQGAVIADEVHARGVFLPATVVDGVTDAKKWGVYAGNICGGPVNNKDRITEDPHFHMLPVQLRNAVALKMENKAGSIVVQLRDQAKAAVMEVLAGKIKQYGGIYRESAAMQVELLSLRAASRLLKGVNDEQSSHIEHLQHGYEYLLGARQDISASAARVLTKAELSRSILKDASKTLKTLSNTSENSIAVSIWPQETHYGAVGYDAAFGMLHESIHPSFKETGREELRKQEVFRRLPKHVYCRPLEVEHRIIANLDHVADRLASLGKAHTQNVQQEHKQQTR